MSFSLELTVRRSERALERLIGVVGRRGYEVTGVSANLVAGGHALAVKLTLESERPAELLAKHLEKLHEVSEVRAGTSER